MMRWCRFPPRTEEIQFDEKWAFVYQKERPCDPAQLGDRRRGENGDHVAFDPQHRLVLEVVPGKRHQRQIRTLVQAAQRRTGGRMMRLLTSDQHILTTENLIESQAALTRNSKHLLCCPSAAAEI